MRKKFCIQGHLYTPESTYLSSSNKRHCLICQRERDRAAGKMPIDEYRKLRIESGIQRRADEDRHAAVVLPKLEALVTAHCPMVAYDYLPKHVPQNAIIVYCANVSLGWDYTRCARHFNISPDVVRRRTQRVEEARDHPEFDFAMERIEELIRGSFHEYTDDARRDVQGAEQGIVRRDAKGRRLYVDRSASLGRSHGLRGA